MAPGDAVDRVACAVEADSIADLGAEPLVERNAELREHGEELLVRTDAGAARREVVRHPFEDIHFPSLVVQEVGGKEPAERPADDDRA
jgi:hypothetical protein